MTFWVLIFSFYLTGNPDPIYKDMITFTNKTMCNTVRDMLVEDVKELETLHSEVLKKGRYVFDECKSSTEILGEET